MIAQCARSVFTGPGRCFLGLLFLGRLAAIGGGPRPPHTRPPRAAERCPELWARALALERELNALYGQDLNRYIDTALAWEAAHQEAARAYSAALWADDPRADAPALAEHRREQLRLFPQVMPSDSGVVCDAPALAEASV